MHENLGFTTDGLTVTLHNSKTFKFEIPKIIRVSILSYELNALVFLLVLLLIVINEISDDSLLFLTR
jgi:hypothetical protein